MPVAKKPGAKKVPAKKLAARKPGSGAGATEAPAAEGVQFSVGDVVVAVGDGDASGAGRVCRVLNFDRYCVNFSDIGCRRVAGSSLHAAPTGTDAPDCTGCADC